MPKQQKPISIPTSDKRGPDYCDPECPHAVEFNRFPQRIMCKLSGRDLVGDVQGNFKRTVFCKYMMGEEVPERFWSPYKEEG